MKVHIADAGSCPVPQFVIEAENAQDRMLLKAFCSFPRHAKDEWIFWMHGESYNTDHGDGPYAFNFGWMKKQEPTT